MSAYAAEGTQDAEVPNDPATATAEESDPARSPADVPAPAASDSPPATAADDDAGDAVPEDDTPEDGAAEDGAAENGTPDGSTPDDDSLRDGTTEDGTTEDGTTEDGDDPDGGAPDHDDYDDYDDPDYDDDPDYEGGYYDDEAPYERRKLSKLAVVALVTGIVALVPVAIITGIAALVGIRRSGRRGQGMAVSGLFIAVAWLVLGGAIGVMAHVTHGFRKPEKVVYTEASVFKLKEGDCVNTPNGRQVTVVSCTSPHDSEIFGTFALPAGAWPGTAAVRREARSGCSTRLTTYINPQLAITLAQTYVYPTQVDWTAGTRTVICEVHAVTGQLSQSVRGAP